MKRTRITIANVKASEVEQFIQGVRGMVFESGTAFVTLGVDMAKVIAKLNTKEPQTRAIDPKRKAEDAFKTDVAALFTRLADDYPASTVAEQIAGMDALEPDAILKAVSKWFADNPGQRWSQDLTDLLADHYRQVFNLSGALALDELGMTASFDLKNPAMIEALEDLAAERVTGIDDETRAQIVTQLVQGSDAGEGVEALGRRLRSHIGDMSKDRAELIAVTETATAFSRASLACYEKNNVERKRWLTASDDKVTPECQANEDAGAIGTGDDFPSGDDAPPRFPGCRCSVSPVIDGYEVPENAWTGV